MYFFFKRVLFCLALFFGAASLSLAQSVVPKPMIKAGYYHTLALKADGTVWAWGRGDLGQLGRGTLSNSSVPIEIVALRYQGVIAIDAGDNHSMALTSDGRVFTWGYNNVGQLGISNLVTQTTPQQVTNATISWWAGSTNIVENRPLPKIKRIAAGANHSLALAGEWLPDKVVSGVGPYQYQNLYGTAAYNALWPREQFVFGWGAKYIRAIG